MPVGGDHSDHRLVVGGLQVQLVKSQGGLPVVGVGPLVQGFQGLRGLG